MAKTKMTKEAAIRIQRSTAIKHGGKVPKDSFSSRATRTVAKKS